MTPSSRFTPVQIALFTAVGLTVIPGCVGGEDKEDTATSSGLCESPESLLDATGNPTGYERCADGTYNRTAVVTTPPEIPGDTCAGTEFDLDCTTDADCTDGAYGRCLSGDRASDGYYGYTYYDTAEDTTYCGCTYSCATDSDCGANEACIITGLVETGRDYATCQPVDCKTNDDCESGECSLTSFNDGCGYTVNLTCRDAEVDSCRTDADCEGGELGPYCAPDYATDEYVCQDENCAIGRPLLVDGVARKASGVRRADWSDTNSVSVSGLNRKTRRALAKYWSGVAAMEHASVASFARFALQLMAIGAPPALLLETQAAGMDEVRHAQTTFGIASAYAGSPVGPGPMSFDGVQMHTDIVGVLRGLVMEACVGETLGVAEAHAAAEAAADPAMAAALHQIAVDETRHSALAWKTLKWILEANPELKSVAADAFAEGIRDILDAEMSGPAGLDAHGVLSPERRREVYVDAISELVLPCMGQLLGTVGYLGVNPRSNDEQAG